jgi:thioredoxin:protein disulfide reductase
VLGGAALFSLAAGMSVPLVLLGLSAGSLLPRAGAWMESVKHAFGLVLLGVAIWMVTPVTPTWALMLAWGGLALLAGWLLWRSARQRGPVAARLAQVLAVVIAAAGLLEVGGALSGGRDVLRPWAHWNRDASAVDTHATLLPFRTIKSVDDLDAVLASAGRPVLLDFYADWCVSCKEMERFTFPDARVQAHFANAVLLRADVTANDAQDKALLRRFGLFGPPGILFFDASGQERRSARVIGYESTPDFLESLQRAGL